MIKKRYFINYHQTGGNNYKIDKSNWIQTVLLVNSDEKIIFNKSNENLVKAIDYIIDQWEKGINIEKTKEQIFNNFRLWEFENSPDAVGKRFVTLDPNSFQILMFFDSYILTYLFINRKDKIIFRFSKDFTYGIPSINSVMKAEKVIALKQTNISGYGNSTHTIDFYTNYYFDLYQKLIEVNKSFNFNEEIEWNDEKKFFHNSKNMKGLYNVLLSMYQYYSLYKEDIVSPKNKERMIASQLNFISILGKARFWHKDLQIKAKNITKKLISNLLFLLPKTGFITGGYKGFKSKMYGITRSGYETAKEHEKPVLTIMCKEGLDDYHLKADATYIFGEHWGEDTVALASLTDSAIFIAPVGGWSYLEMINILYHDKPVAILNDCFQANDHNFSLYNQVEMNQIIGFKLDLLNLMKENDIEYADDYITKYYCWLDINAKQNLDKNILRLSSVNRDKYNSVKLDFSDKCYNVTSQGKQITTTKNLMLEINGFIDENIQNNKLDKYYFPRGTRGIWKSLTKIEGEFKYIPVFEDYGHLSVYFYNNFKLLRKQNELTGKYKAMIKLFSKKHIIGKLADNVMLNKELDGYLSESGNIVESDNDRDPLIYEKFA